MSKADEYQGLLIAYDKLDHEISQLKAINAGINMTEETLKKIEVLKSKQQGLINQAAKLQEGI
jgi:uncharacterized protein YdcH (DUF465 family)